MPETCENWLCVVNSCVYYAHQAYEIYEVLYDKFTSGALKSTE